MACQTSPWISLISTGRRVPRTVQSVGLVDDAERHQVQSTKRSGHSDIRRPCGIRAGNVSIESCHTESGEIGADALAAKLLSNGVHLQRPCCFCFEVLRSCSSGRRRVMCSGYCWDLFARQLRRHTSYNHYHIINIKIITRGASVAQHWLLASLRSAAR